MTDEATIGESEMRRIRVAEALAARSMRLAGMYRAALRELDSPAAPGDEAARISIIAHCMREVMNGLPAAMAASIMPRPTPNSSSLLSRLRGVLSSHSQLDLRAEQSNVPVPAEVATVIADLVEAAAKEEGLNVANAAALLTDGTHTKHPLLSQWKSAQRFFLDWTHLDRNADGKRALPTDSEVVVQIRVVEDVVEVRSALFFTNLSAVEDILAIANAQEEGSVT